MQSLPNRNRLIAGVVLVMGEAFHFQSHVVEETAIPLVAAFIVQLDGQHGKSFKINIWNLPEVPSEWICVPMKDRGLTLSRLSTWEPPFLLWNEKASRRTSATSTEILKPLTA